VTAPSAFQPIPVSHLGFLSDAPKRAVLPAGSGTRFVLQDMGIHTKETLGEFEDWQGVLDGILSSTWRCA
jgi:hypothetical protein